MDGRRAARYAASVLAVETDLLAKTYPRSLGGEPVTALAGVSLRVEQGTAFGLIGPNGAGKTTFIKLLLGIAQPSGGRVRLFGGSPNDPAARARVGYLPELLDLPASWTPIQFLRSVGRLKGLAGIDPEARRQLERVGMSAEAGRRMGGFSKGMRQRVGLAGALMGGPDLLVLDEPTDGLDPLGRIAVREILTAELGRGGSLLLNSHLLSETERICDRIGVLARGRLVREGPLSELSGETDAYRCRFALPSPESALAVLGFAAGDEAGIFRLRAACPEELNAKLDAARSGGALLVDLRRDARDLEEVLAAAMQAAS
jgi:ABC-2 type transport system ATP-binding protein